MENKYAARIEDMEPAAKIVRSLFGSMVNKKIISFGGGAPANQVLPVDQIREITNEVLRVDNRGVEALAYGPINGIADLREIVAKDLLQPKGVAASSDNIFIITGGLEAMYLTCQVFIDPGDVILVESPTFVQSVLIFEMFQAKCIPIDMDDDGVDVVDLEEKIKKYNPKMVYIIPTFQNPTGRTLSLERRKKIAELANQYDTLVLEDDPYRDIRFSGEDLPPIKAFDKNENIILACSFSKIFSPGVRLGYLYANDDVIKKVWNIQLATTSHTAIFPQVICAEFFKRGYYPEHHKKICDLYRERKNAMVDSIKEFFPEGTKYTNPDGGLFCWVEVPGDFDTEALEQQALEDPEIGVAYVPGEKFFVSKELAKKNCMRLSYGNVEVADIRVGIERLAKLFT